MHRSGTSAIAKGIVELGAHPGNNLLPEDEGNPKGYWEDANIVNLNDKILLNFNMRWHSQDNPMVNRFETLLPLYEEKYLEEATEIINNNFKLSETILFKDPRISILLPFWQKVFHIVGADVKYVLALRNPLETSKSLLKRNRMEIEQGIKLWSYYNFMILRNIKSDFFVCSFSSLLNNPIQELERINRHIDINKSNADLKEYCSNFLENSLKHYNEDVDKLKEYLGENHDTIAIFDKLYRWSSKDIVTTSEVENFVCRYLESLTQNLGYSSNEHIDNYAQVFLNEGSGFSEGNSYKYNLNTTTNSLDIYVDEHSLVKELRLDPSYYSCMLIINSIRFEANDKLIDYELMNGNYQYNFNNIYIFENEDPQIIIKPGEINFTRANINFSLFSIDTYTHSILSTIKSQKNNQLKNILDIQEQKINKKQEEIEVIDQIVEIKEQELSEVVQEIEDKENEIIRYRKEIKSKDQVIENKEEELGKMVQVIKGQEQEINKHQEEIKAKEKIIENREQELNKINHEIFLIKEQLDTTEFEISGFLELLNKQKAQRYRRFFLYLFRILKNIVKILVHPRKRIKLLYNKRMLKNSKVFDENFYLFKNKDLVLANVDLLEHFIESGWKEGRSPNAIFNMELHLQQQPTCLVEGKNPVIAMIIKHNRSK